MDNVTLWWAAITIGIVALILGTGFLVMRRYRRESLAMLEENKKGATKGAPPKEPKRVWDGFTNATSWGQDNCVTYGISRLATNTAHTPCVYEVFHVRWVDDKDSYVQGLMAKERKSRLTYVLAEADTCVDAWVDLARDAGLAAFSVRYRTGTEPLSASAREAEAHAAQHADVLVVVGCRFVRNDTIHEDAHLAACIRGAGTRGAKLVGTETHAADSDEARKILTDTAIGLEAR